MATKEQIEILLEQLKKAPPSECFQNCDMNAAGIRAILKILNKTDDKITAGKISEYMQVSTARVAVLLRKMVAKGYIEKEADSVDGRVVVVRLSEYGRQTAEKLKENLYHNMGEMIDKIGMERMLEFATISKEIHSLMKENKYEKEKADV